MVPSLAVRGDLESSEEGLGALNREPLAEVYVNRRGESWQIPLS